MLSNKPLDQSKEIPEIYRQRIVEFNQQSFDELLTFVDIVPDDAFDLGFIQSNFAKDRDAIIQALINHPDCQDMQFEIWDFPDPDMRFLMDEILKILPAVKVQPDKKLILIVRGVENAIGMTGEYPPMLVDFNWVRDAYPVKVPHLMLFFLPDYAITRVANFAPDFWAWNSGTFVFKTPQDTQDYAVALSLEASKDISNCEVPERQERIDLLERLLMEYSPSNGDRETQGNLKSRIRVLNALGVAYRSRGDYSKATDFLKQSIKLAKDDKNLESLKASALYDLGWIQDDWGNKQEAIALYQQSLELYEKIGNVGGKAASLHNLAVIYANRGDVGEAIALYQQSLELYEKIGDVQGKAASLHQLAGIYANRGDVEKAIALYQQSLELEEKIGNVQGKAASFAMLGQLLADEKGDFEQALNYLQQSLEILQHLHSPDAETVRRIIAGVQQMADG